MKIQIIGPSGAGKTTLGKYISEQLNINFIDTDSYYWKDYANRVPNSNLERETIFLNDLNIDKDNWVISGSIFSWNKKHLMDKDVLIYLSINEEKRIKRLIERRDQTENYSGIDNDFIKWAKNYHTEVDPKKGGTYVCHMAEIEMVKKITNAKIFFLNGEYEVEENFKKIK